jgi:hypothetical protein
VTVENGTSTEIATDPNWSNCETQTADGLGPIPRDGPFRLIAGRATFVAVDHKCGCNVARNFVHNS